MMSDSMFIIIASAFLSFLVYILIKSYNDYKQDIKIIYAVHAYMIDKNDIIVTGDILKDTMNIKAMYDSIGYYKPKLYRLIDWGYENIVPPEVLEKIKPYIEG